MSVLLNFPLACAIQPDDEKTQTWEAFVAPLEEGFLKQKQHVIPFGQLLIDENIYKLKELDGKISVQWVEGSAWVEAPARLQLLKPHYDELFLFGAGVDRGFVNLAFRTFGPAFNGIPLVTTVSYTLNVNGDLPICDRTTIESEMQGGRCFWPLPEPGWYMDFFWMEHDVEPPLSDSSVNP